MPKEPEDYIPEYRDEWRTGRSEEIYQNEARAVEIALSKGLMPRSEYRGISEDWGVRCLDCEQEFVTTLSKMRVAKFACPTCLKSQQILSANDSSSEVFLILAERQLEPLEEYSGNSAKKWKCKCLKCGKTVYPRLHDLKIGKNGCKGCGSRAHLTEERLGKIATIMQNAHLQPIGPYQTSSQPWECICLRCGEKVTPTFQNVSRGHGGCIYCQEHSFKHTKPAYFYVMEQPDLGALKVGVGNIQSRPDRIKTHIKDGWVLHYRLDFAIGRDAFTLETHVLRWFRKELNLPSFLEQSQMRKAGRTETISGEAVTVLQVRHKVDALILDLRLPVIVP